MKDGIININKPAGMTSHDVIGDLRRLLGMKKIGHTGTLDPMATGVLPICLGKATRVAENMDMDFKTYRCTMSLGVITDTQDIWGEVLELRDTANITEAAVHAAVAPFQGENLQLPPMYSAVKINGQPLYKAARKGQTVERTPRPITIYDMEDLGSPAPDEYTARVACSRGTYSRGLAEESGDALGVPATLSALRRTQAGVFSLAQCHTLPEILAAAESGELETNGWVLPIESVFAPLPALHVNSGVKAHLLNGCPTRPSAAADGRYRTHAATGPFPGLAHVDGAVRPAPHRV
mgnify:CR=1 FL=1